MLNFTIYNSLNRYEVVYITKAKPAPLQENNNGYSFTYVGNHSEDNLYCFEGNTNNELPQKSEPRPILKSRLKYPINILAKVKMIKGNVLGHPPSCANS